MREVRKAPFVSGWKRNQFESVMRNESEYCLKEMNERKESEKNLSFEALVCFFCGFSRDASLDVWMKFRLSSDTQTSRWVFRPSAHRYNHHSERYNKSCMNSIRLKKEKLSQILFK